MDRDRFRKRSRELNERARLVSDLAKMPDRATAKDFREVADLMSGAASDIDELLQANLPGCACRRIENDNYSYLHYAESCRHHGRLYLLEEDLKARYEKAEHALKNEVRLRFVTAALSGAAVSTDVRCGWDTSIVNRAIAIADEAVRQFAEEAK
jgi:hypothetical protein